VQNVRANVQESDTRVANTRVSWALHQAAPAQSAGLDTIAGIMGLAQELLIWIRSDLLFSLFAAAPYVGCLLMGPWPALMLSPPCDLLYIDKPFLMASHKNFVLKTITLSYTKKQPSCHEITLEI